MKLTDNLNTDRFRNGDVIPEAKTDKEWQEAGINKQPAWCYYNNDPANGEKYGKLYNWYAVNDPRSLAPEGFHIPTQDEIKVFKKKFFLGLEGGFRYINGYFGSIGYYGFWWSAAEVDTDFAWYTALYYSSSNVGLSNVSKEYGFSVRCIED